MVGPLSHNPSHASASSVRLSASGHRGSFSWLAGGIGVRRGHFIDQYGRVQILRGVNLGGSSKLPTNYHHADHVDSHAFFENAPSVSFVGRPFPLDEADEHFARLQRWGFSLVRFIVTWEAIEHEGPGKYDHAYLEYIRTLVQKAQQYDLHVYVDPHQDVWSRWTGGDGAPMWTLECIGLEPRNFDATKAALCIETCGKRVDEFPKMIWPTNYFKFACSTMFTLFWAGARVAPGCHVNGVQVQEYLQSHYIKALTELAKVLQGLHNVVGFGTMNEPSAGYLGVKDLAKHFSPTELKYDLAPTPFQGMCLAEGHAQQVETWSNGIRQHVFGLPDAKRWIDPDHRRAWKDGFGCVWKDEGVWKVAADGSPQLLKPDHFAHLDFGRECYVPFAKRYIESIRSALPNTLLFVELPPLEFSCCAFPEIPTDVIPHAVNATHWYDGVTLFLRTWRPYFSVDPATKMPAFGRRAVRRMHRKQLAHIKELGREQMHNAPTLIGETGIPFNLNNGKAYVTGNYSAQIDALDHTISCLEANLLSFTLWCYAPDNCHRYGDQWNLEDLSLVSSNHDLHPLEEGAHEDDACARALRAFARPHAMKISGIPSQSCFSLELGEYQLEYTSDAGKRTLHIIAPTEIYVPHVQYPKGYVVAVSSGRYEVQEHEGYDVIVYHHDEKQMQHKVQIVSKDPRVLARRKSMQQLRNVLCIGLIVGLLALLILSIYLAY